MSRGERLFSKLLLEEEKARQGSGNYKGPSPPSEGGSLGTALISVAMLFFVIYLARKYLYGLYTDLLQSLGVIPIAIICGTLVLPIGIILYQIRENWLMLYAYTEIVFGIFYATYTISDKIGWRAYKETNPNNLATWTAIASSVYIVVRGLDNRKKAKEASSEANKNQHSQNPQNHT